MIKKIDSYFDQNSVFEFIPTNFYRYCKEHILEIWALQLRNLNISKTWNIMGKIEDEKKKKVNVAFRSF